MVCEDEYDRFKACKRSRDVKIYSAIREWESDNLGKMDMKTREAHFSAMEVKLSKLQQDFEKIPFSASFQNKMWRYNSDIEQLQWRLDYGRKLFAKA